MIILASGSATRRDMLARAGIEATICPASVDETAVKSSSRAEGRSAAETASILAEMKAAEISHRHPEVLVIGADQILECGDHWFDKPADLPAAAGHLARLRGRQHHLRTSVVCMRAGAVLWRHTESPSLTMRILSDCFIADYLALEGEAILGSVGAYRLEGPGIQLFERIEGDFFAILGLPLLPLLEFLRRQGFIQS